MAQGRITKKASGPQAESRRSLSLNRYKKLKKKGLTDEKKKQNRIRSRIEGIIREKSKQ